MGWIERVQSSGGKNSAKNTDFIARRVAKGIGFSVDHISAIEKKLEIPSDYDEPTIDRVLSVATRLSSGGLGLSGNRWKVVLEKEDITANKAREKAKSLACYVDKYGNGIIQLVRVDKDALAYVIVKENNVPEALRLPVCTLVEREQESMVFVKEVSNLFRDLVVTEKWSD